MPPKRFSIPDGYKRAAFYAASYAAWVVAFKLFLLTLLTYLLMSSNAKFQEISDSYASNELTFMGLAAIGFVIVIRLLNPITSIATDEIITAHRIKKQFFPGFSSGALLAIGVAFAFLLSGLYRYVGFFVQTDEPPLAIANFVIRTLAVIILAYCEEFIFRYKVMNHLRRQLPDLYAAVITTVIYCGIKLIQFDLGIMQMLMLFVVSLLIAVRTTIDGDFGRGAGYWTGMLFVFHPVLSLPVFGNEFQGLFLIRYQSNAPGDSGILRILTGGVGGPLSSLALQILLLADLGRLIVKNKKNLLNPKTER